jgi:hypothetical protein
VVGQTRFAPRATNPVVVMGCPFADIHREPAASPVNRARIHGCNLDPMPENPDRLTTGSRPSHHNPLSDMATECGNYEFVVT